MAVRPIRSGGDLDQAYDRAGTAMAPLGLGAAERPRVTIEARGAAPYRVGPKIRGALVVEGERHGRRVSVTMPGEGVRSGSEVRLAGPSVPFGFRARNGRLKAEEGAPEAVGEMLASMPNSVRWNGMRGTADASGIIVERMSGQAGDWLLDLWLAERLVGAVER